MTNLKRSIGFCCMVIMLLLSCSACSNDSASDGKGTVEETVLPNYEEMAVASVETALKNRLKNPESLQIHSANLADDYFEDDTTFLGTIVVDYSAQNGFGGYNRDTVRYFVEISKEEGSAIQLDESAYLNRRIKLQFGDGLQSIGNGIPLQFICSEEDYAQLSPKIRRECGDCSLFTYNTGERELTCISHLGNLEGTTTFFFYAESVKIYQIKFFWANEQSYYDGTNAYTLGTEYIATLEDVDALRDQIDRAINVPHGEIKETTETYFHDYECVWNLADGIYIKLTWTINDMDGSIGHIQLLFCNEANGEAG